MRSFLLSCLLLVAILLKTGTQESYAQCTLSNINIKLNSALTVAGNCVINIDLSFDQTNNNGNKWTTIHLWTAANYPSYGYGSPPTLATLANAIGTIEIANPASATPTLNPTYPNAPTAVIIPATGVTKTNVSGGSNRFTITGITFTLPGACSNPISIIGDIWSSNANSNNAVQCTSVNHQFYVNDPLVTGSISCTPRQFEVNITSLSNTSKQATFAVYADLAPFGIFNAGDPLIYTSGTVTVPALGTYNSGLIAYATNPNENLWAVVQEVGNPYTTTALIINHCGGLPVTINSFSGQRQNNSSVMLKWSTASEQNNTGFDIQRKSGTGDFQSVGFVATQASGGNSNSLLNYQFADNNSSEDFTEYRLAQKDLDGKLTYSSTVVVKGSKGAGLSILVFPNPSPDGKVNLTFGDAMAKDIQVTDNSGKVVQQKKSISSSQVTLTGLHSGMYFLSVTVQSTGESTTRKIVVR